MEAWTYAFTIVNALHRQACFLQLLHVCGHLVLLSVLGVSEHDMTCCAHKPCLRCTAPSSKPLSVSFMCGSV